MRCWSSKISRAGRKCATCIALLKHLDSSKALQINHATVPFCPQARIGTTSEISLPTDMYKMYIYVMEIKSVTSSEFRKTQSQLLEEAQRTPVVITSRGSRARAVVVSPAFFARAVEALEDLEDIRAAEIARQESAEISFEDLKKELGFA